MIDATQTNIRKVQLKCLRAACQWDQNEAAKRAGIARRTVLEGENGIRISPKTWSKLIHAYGEAGAVLIDVHPMAWGIVVSRAVRIEGMEKRGSYPEEAIIE
jgi:DNA-binding XRE family transcriptional regulator